MAMAAVAAVHAHEPERTRVTLTLSPDGHFDLTVANDPLWLLLRLETFAGGSVPANLTPPQRDTRLAQFRLTGTMPTDATRLRWLYGLVADSYPLEIRKPDGTSTIEWIDGTNWS